MTDWPTTPVASDGQVRVCGDRCTTCIFRPGNLLGLRPGRVQQMVDDAVNNEGHIVCHTTLNTDHGAICRGFADHPMAHRSLMLRIGIALGILTTIDPDRGQ